MTVPRRLVVLVVVVWLLLPFSTWLVVRQVVTERERALTSVCVADRKTWDAAHALSTPAHIGRKVGYTATERRAAQLALDVRNETFERARSRLGPRPVC